MKLLHSAVPFVATCAMLVATAPALAKEPAQGGERAAPGGKTKATKELVESKREAAAHAASGLRELIAKAPPKGLSVDEKKAFETFVGETKAIIAGCEALSKKLDDGLKESKDLDALSEMSSTESLRLQMAMDRLSKMMSTLSNLLKKISDTAGAITQNLK
jgi:Skp family chaperone for outer membrane proteins